MKKSKILLSALFLSISFCSLSPGKKGYWERSNTVEKVFIVTDFFATAGIIINTSLLVGRIAFRKEDRQVLVDIFTAVKNKSPKDAANIFVESVKKNFWGKLTVAQMVLYGVVGGYFCLRTAYLIIKKLYPSKDKQKEKNEDKGKSKNKNKSKNPKKEDPKEPERKKPFHRRQVTLIEKSEMQYLPGEFKHIDPRKVLKLSKNPFENSVLFVKQESGLDQWKRNVEGQFDGQVSFDYIRQFVPDCPVDLEGRYQRDTDLFERARFIFEDHDLSSYENFALAAAQNFRRIASLKIKVDKYKTREPEDIMWDIRRKGSRFEKLRHMNWLMAKRD